MKFKGTQVWNPRTPRKMMDGGYVKKANGMSARQRSNDSVMTVLQPGEAVIPVKYYHKGAKKPLKLADRVLAELRKQGIKLPK